MYGEWKKRTAAAGIPSENRRTRVVPIADVNGTGGKHEIGFAAEKALRFYLIQSFLSPAVFFFFSTFVGLFRMRTPPKVEYA